MPTSWPSSTSSPLSPGHTLVIPKEPAATLDQLSDASAAAIGRVLPRIARAVMAATGATAYNVLQNNGAAAHQAVFHVHFHIIPKPEGGGGLGIGWPAGRLDPGRRHRAGRANRRQAVAAVRDGRAAALSATRAVGLRR